MSLVDEINKIPILEVANKLDIKIARKNSAMCFRGHDKNTPSLSFSPSKNLWFCFSCCKGGSNIQLVMESLELDFQKTLSWFGFNFNLSSENNFKKFKIDKTNNFKIFVKNEIVEKIFYEPNHEIYSFLLSKLSLSNLGFNYLKSRGYSLETIEKLNLLDLTNPEKIIKYLNDNYQIEDLIKCGLIKKEEESNNNKFIWRQHSLIIPFYGIDKNLIYLQGRSINSLSPWKYLNLYGLSKPIYNLNKLNDINKGAKIYLFEGVTDCIMGIQSGFNSFGILGASGFKEQWTEYFTNFNINIVPDNDKAGDGFANRITEYFAKVGKRVQVRKIPFGKDFSEFSQSQII